MELDSVMQDGADAYDVAAAAGARFITQSWRQLSEVTRVQLMQSQRYDIRGALEPGTLHPFGEPIGDFEYQLGVLVLASQTRLPRRFDVDGTVSGIVLRDEILTAAANVMYGTYGHDAVVLRTAILAVRNHQIANLLTRLPVRKLESVSPTKSIAYIAGVAGAFFALPAVLAMVLGSVAQFNQSGITTGLYVLAGLGLILGYAHNSKASVSKEEQAYLAWTSFDSFLVGDLTARGVGAAAYFGNMLHQGFVVPPVLFDLCDSLRTATRPTRYKG